jgi:outer membrane protein
MTAPTLLFLFLAFPAAAQEKPEESSRLRWGIGAGAISSPRPYTGAESDVIVVPAVQLQYGRWFVQGIRGGYELVSSSAWTVSAFAQARFQELSPGDSPALSGMEPRGKSMDGGVETVFRSRPVGFRLSAATDVLGRSNGQELTAQAITGAPLGKRLLLLATFGPRWESARRIDYYYGVRLDEATEARDAYVGAGSTSWDFSLSALYRPADRWTVFALWNRTALGDAIRESPIVDRKSSSALAVFVTREF